MLHIAQAETAAHVADVRELWREYLHWLNSMLTHDFNVTFDIAVALEHDMATRDKFAPPGGRLLLATFADRPAGVGSLKQLSVDTGEITRLYVRPGFHGAGIGQALVAALLAHARIIGYHQVRLDSGPFMQPAHALYRSVGFREIAPYPEREVPAAWHDQWLFMEKGLG